MNHESIPCEHRAEPRLNRRLRAWYRCDQAAFRRTRAFNVSQGGALILTRDKVEQQDELHLTLRLDYRHYVTLIGRPAWQARLPEDGWLTGIQFQVEGTEARTLQCWVRRERLLIELWALKHELQALWTQRRLAKAG
ncbi:MAG: PilZ domain-containing protein [Candidatus Eremiobacterota bacterium]